HQEISRGDAPQIIKRDVLKNRALCERDRRDSGSDGGQHLNVPAAAQLFRDQTGKDHHNANGNGRKKPEACERCAEQDEFEASEQRRDGRVSDKAPVEVASVVQSLEFVAVESVLAVGENVEEYAAEGDQ